MNNKLTKYFTAFSAAILLIFSGEQLRAECCNTFDIGANLLYLKPCFDDLDYAYVTDTSGDEDLSKYKYVCHNWEPAFEIFLGKQNLFCGFDFLARYGRVTGSRKESVEVGANETLTPTLGIVGISGPYTEAASKHSFSYNDFDLLFSRACQLRTCHTLTPFVGVTGLFIDQDIRANYVTSSDELVVKWDGNYWGVGFKVGTQYDIHFNDCFSFFVRGSGAIVTGNLSNTQHEEALALSAEKWTSEECLFVPGMQISLGLNYSVCFCETLVDFVLGYEFQHWYNIPTPRRQEVWTVSKGMLGFHGLKAGFHVNF